MTEIRANAGRVFPAQRSRLYWAASDTRTMIQRSMLHIIRNIDSLLTGFILPVMLLLVFVYVFGGAINSGSTRYINYVVPGIILLCAGYGASFTAINVANDMTVGLIDRFCTMPIHSASVLTGHVAASLARNTISTLLVLGVALLIGFQPAAGLLAWLAAAGILLLFMLAMSWISVVFGLLANGVESASAYSFTVLFLPYVSSAFVPPDTMPAALQWFAKNQPITHVIETLRALMVGGPTGPHGWLAVAWCVGLIVVSYGLAVYLFQRKTSG